MYDFPYINNFNDWCSTRHLQAQTIQSINQSVNYFWNYYLTNANHTPNLDELSSQDIRSFLVNLEVNENRSVQTLNKYITHLKKYFSFLYDHKLMPNYVLTDIKGHTFDRTPRFCLDWIDSLDKIIANEKVSLDTKKLLILIAYGFEPNKLLGLTIADVQGKINKKTYIDILSTPALPNLPQLIFHTKKGRPLSALPSLSRRILADRDTLNLDLTPGKLRLSYIYRLVNDSSLSDDDLTNLIHCNRKTITYYRDQATKASFIKFKPNF
ncbi:site-specific recombinase XerC [Lactobacillus colini]|uniref:Site-specific recombinase XerC n=1 Tax=Lactobacillus colini TaxID=1819254 RepID=A0ABS4MF48_9LACO|nr:site-specific integrase [Lactobacillus colini]MBP2057961.1 site-specific recombinase XerC [Lactobacillus colini]